jgi:hypothetical protein
MFADTRNVKILLLICSNGKVDDLKHEAAEVGHSREAHSIVMNIFEIMIFL